MANAMLSYAPIPDDQLQNSMRNIPAYDFEYRPSYLETMQNYFGDLGNRMKSAMTSNSPDAEMPISFDTMPIGSIKSVANALGNPNFAKWFKGSQVIDESGRPLIVYHGSPDARFSVFSDDMKGIRSNHNPEDVGFHFTTSPQTADAYSGAYKLGTENDIAKRFGREVNPERLPPAGATIPVFLKANNLLDVGYSKNINADTIAHAKLNGYDGIIADMGTGKEYVVFNPNQIKSVFNRGTFDPNDPNIMHSYMPSNALSQDNE